MKKLKLISLMLLVLVLCVSLFACAPTEDPTEDPSNDPIDGPSDGPTDDTQYDITSFKIAGNDIKEYVIVANRAVMDYFLGADAIKAAILDKTGENLLLNSAPVEGKRSIVLKEVEQAGRSGFRVSVKDGDLYIECAYKALTKTACEEFVAAVITPAMGEFEIAADYVYEAPVKTIKYSDYGAKGDGVTDDYAAIKAAHDDANKYGYTVEGDANATYLIGALGLSTVTVKTDTDWKGAKFIIDDRVINTEALASSLGIPLFTVEPSMRRLTINTTDVPSLKKGASELGYAPGVDCLVYVQYNGVKHYIRYGNNANSGAYQQEILLVRADGKIDANTRPMWDYPQIDKIWAVPIDEIPITVQNGTFKTLANTVNPDKYISVNRGIVIKRSNTDMKNIKHTVEQVEDYRAAYAGFFNVRECNDVLIYNCEIFCHKSSYFLMPNGDRNLLGSYELSAGHANNVTYDKVIQTNFFDVENEVVHDQGLMGTNYCKNMYVTNSRFARFDAHCQVYNLTVKKSDLQRVNTIGAGTVKIDNTNFWGSFMVDLRSDYGGFFDGDFHFKNVTIKYKGSNRIAFFSGSWANHDFGYKVVQPQNIYVDNLTVEQGGRIYLYTSGLDGKPDLTADTVNGQPNLNPIVPTKLIKVTKNPAGTIFIKNSGATFKDTVIELPENESGETPPLPTSMVDCGFNSEISVNENGFVTTSTPGPNGAGSIRFQLSGNGHNHSNLKLANNNGDQALLFTGIGNPNNVDKGTNICVDLLPTPNTAYTDQYTYESYKGKSFVISFQIKPLTKTTDAHDELVSSLFTFNNSYSTAPGFVQNGMITMSLNDYSLKINASGNREEVDLGVKLEVGKFSTITMFVNVKENKFDLYINDTKVANALPFLNETEISQIATYNSSGELVPSEKANKMEDFLITYARLARVNGWQIEAPIYEFDNAKFYFADSYPATTTPAQ